MLNRADFAILQPLQDDGRARYSDMARELGPLNTTLVMRRVERLERLGVIRGYHADIDVKALEPGD